MPYKAILEDLVRSVDRLDGALLLDASGELVVGSGDVEMRHRLVGAYQAIVLAHSRRAASRYALGDVRCLVWRYTEGTVIVRPLKDGYYLVVGVAREGDVAGGLFRSADVQDRLNAEL